jgi:hypothetical protein
MTDAGDLSHSIEEMAGMIHWWVGAWHDFGYENPPAPGCKPIPPLGERSAEAIRGVHKAVEEIDELTRRLSRLRDQLLSELRQDIAIRARSIDAARGQTRSGSGGAS